MTFKVLVVDDSNFFLQRLKEMINQHPQLEVVAVANNGRDAVDKVAKLKPDVVTMDFEMPVLDGVSAVRQIMSATPVPILMFSSLTYEGARVTLDALEAGAVDFMLKDFSEVSRGSAALKAKLHENLLSIAKQGKGIDSSAPKKPIAAPAPSSKTVSRSISPNLSQGQASSIKTPPVAAYAGLKKRVRLLVIGASTGGPVALMEVLKELPANFSLPILLIQHMPENFTKAFAERLSRQCKIEVREAVDGDKLKPGVALLAPGGKQMMLDKRGDTVRVIDGDDRVNYKPSVDITFASAANSFTDSVLGVILTGMGADGCEGARILKEQGSSIWSQDEASSIIYGMPMAVARANLTDRVLSLSDMGKKLAEAL